MPGRMPIPEKRLAELAEYRKTRLKRYVSTNTGKNQKTLDKHFILVYF